MRCTTLDQLTDNKRCQTEGHLIDAQHLRVEQERLGHGDLLLLTAREVAGLLSVTYRQRLGERLVDGSASLLHVGPAQPGGERLHLQVFFDGHVGEHGASTDH